MALWRDTFGLEVIGERTGADDALAALWGLEPDRIVRQALLRTPGLTTGAMHFRRVSRSGRPGPRRRRRV